MREVERERGDVERTGVPIGSVGVAVAPVEGHRKHVLGRHHHTVTPADLTHRRREAPRRERLPPKRRVHHHGVRSDLPCEGGGALKLAVRVEPVDEGRQDEHRGVDAQHGHPVPLAQSADDAGVARIGVARNHDLDPVEADLRREAEGVGQATRQDARGSHADADHEATVRRTVVSAREAVVNAS